MGIVGTCSEATTCKFEQLSGELGGVFVFGGYETQRPKNLNKTQNTKLQPNEVVAIWRGRAAEWMSPAACGGAKDMELARTKAPLFSPFFSGKAEKNGPPEAQVQCCKH